MSYLDLFSALHRHQVEYVLVGVPVRLARKEDLIALKQSAGRPIDLADIEHLRKLPPT